MVYTISIGSNKDRHENLALARRRLGELFPDIRFSKEEDTQPLFFRRPDLFANQVACFTSGERLSRVTALLKAIEREAGRLPEEKEREIVRLDLDVLTCDDCICKARDLERPYVRRGLQQLRQADTGSVEKNNIQ